MESIPSFVNRVICHLLLLCIVLWVRTAPNEIVNEVGAVSNQSGKLCETFFPARQGGGPILDDWFRNALDCISGSPRLELSLQNTKFLKDPAGILKAILLNEWVGTGYLASSTASYKGDITKFLKAGESPEDASDLLSAACRLVQVLAYLSNIMFKSTLNS